MKTSSVLTSPGMCDKQDGFRFSWKVYKLDLFNKWSLLWDFFHRSARRRSSALCFTVYFEVWQDFGNVVKLRWVSCVRTEFRQQPVSHPVQHKPNRVWDITMLLWPLVLHSCIYTPWVTGPGHLYYLLILFNNALQKTDYICLKQMSFHHISNDNIQWIDNNL